MKDVEKETNEFLIRRFVGCVGYDYKQDYSPHLWPDFSEDTVELWHEIESRLQTPTCLNFDRDAFESTIREELEGQERLLRGGPDYDTSYHYGIKSGLNLAWRIVEDNIRKAEANTVCKWLADEVCVNADSPYCADFCPSTERPRCCVYFEEQEGNNNEDQA